MWPCGQCYLSRRHFDVHAKCLNSVDRDWMQWWLNPSIVLMTAICPFRCNLLQHESSMDSVWDVHALWQYGRDHDNDNAINAFALLFWISQCRFSGTLLLLPLAIPKKRKKSRKKLLETGKFSVMNNSGASGTTIRKMGLILFLVSRNFFDITADDFRVFEKQIWKHPSPLVSLHLCLCNQDVWSWQFEAPGPTTIAGERWKESFFLHLACGLILLDLPQSESIPFKFPPKAELLCNSQQHRAKSVINFWIGLGTGRFSFCTQCLLPPC